MTKAVQFRGRLTLPQILEGIELAQRNAQRLLEDAKTLHAAARYPSATALAILSIEECGKVTILKRLALLTDEAKIKEAWRDYRSHRPKNAHWIMADLANQGARKLTDFQGVLDAEGEHAYLLDTCKQLALYSDCLGSTPNWSDPNNAMDEECSAALIQVAERGMGKWAVTLRELELWQQHVAPHYDKPGMSAAVLAYQSALHAEGLSDTTPEELAAFMGLSAAPTGGA